MEALSKGDTDVIIGLCSDDAKYYRNSGDSLIGKKAITDFWVDRRKNVIKLFSSKMIFGCL